MRNASYSTKVVAILVILAACAAPFASARTAAGPVQVDACAGIQCVHTETNTITNTQTCTASGWVIVVIGSDNEFNVCDQDQGNDAAYG